jgi:threonine dehydratase
MARPNQQSRSPNLRIGSANPYRRHRDEKVRSTQAFSSSNICKEQDRSSCGGNQQDSCLASGGAARGVVTSSTGNHGLGVATAARHRGIDAQIFVSSRISPGKLRLIEECGVSIRRVGDNPLQAELGARAGSVATGRTYVSPYNDPHVIAGQGTIACELLQQVRGQMRFSSLSVALD